MMSSIILLLVALPTSISDKPEPTISADQFARILKSHLDPYADSTFIIEGTREFVGPKSLLKGNADEKMETYQTFFAYKSNGSFFQDKYTRIGAQDRMLHRSVDVLVKNRLEQAEGFPDLDRFTNKSRPSGPSYFFSTGSPCRINFVWYFASLKDPSIFGYTFLGWKQIANRQCYGVRLRLSPNANNSATEGSSRSGVTQEFWIDMERGHVLLYEVYKDNALRTRVSDIVVELVKDKKGQEVWFPMRGNYEIFTNGTEYFKAPFFKETYSVVRDSLVINQGLTDNQFTLDWNWNSVGEGSDFHALRSKSGGRATKRRLKTDSASVKARIDAALKEADMQSDRLLASSASNTADSRTRNFLLAFLGFALLLISCIIIGYRSRTRAGSR